MKLLMITGLGSAVNLAYGKKGAFYYTLEEFHKYWARIDIICPKIKGQESGVKVLFGNVYLHISSLPLILHPIYFVWKCIRLHRTYKFNLMTVQEFPPFYNGIGASIIHNRICVPYVLEIMHIPGYPRASTVKESIYKWLTKLIIKWDTKTARAVRVINQTEAPNFLVRAGVPKNKLVYIPAFYINLDVFKPRDVVKKYDLIFVGRLEKNKGLDILLEIAKKSDLKIIIVGDGPLMKFCKSGHKVLMHGFAKDSAEVAKLINESRALIMLSYNEGGPRVILESLACGVPVIATSVGIVPDVINRNNGRIVNWLADEAIKAFQEIKNTKVTTNMAQFERMAAIKNYAGALKNLI